LSALGTLELIPGGGESGYIAIKPDDPDQIVASGSVLVEAGRTKVICTASVEDRVPLFRRGSGKGWVTAEYGMLPRATTTRTQREASAGRVGGRAIQRTGVDTKLCEQRPIADDDLVAQFGQLAGQRLADRDEMGYYITVAFAGMIGM